MLANVVEYTRDPSVKEVTAPADARPLVVLPGFGNNTTDYTAPFGDTSLALTTHLEVTSPSIPRLRFPASHPASPNLEPSGSSELSPLALSHTEGGMHTSRRGG